MNSGEPRIPETAPTMRKKVLGDFFKTRRSSVETRTPLGVMLRRVRLTMMRPSLNSKRRRHATELKPGQLMLKPGDWNAETM